MRKVKSGISALSVILVLILIISACGSDNGGNTTSADPAEKSANNASATEKPVAAAEPVEIQMWTHESNELEDKYKRERVEAFNAAHDGKIKVTLTGIPRGQNSNGYEERLNVAIAANELPDIVDVDGPNAAAYVQSGILAPMDEYLTDEDLNDFVGSVIEQGTYEGKLYLLAPTESGVVLFYNKKALADAGIKPATSIEDAWTWEEFYQNAKKLKKGENFPVTFFDDYGVGEWQTYMATPFVWSNGSNIISEDGSTTDGYLNSPETVEVLENIAKFYTEKLSTTAPGAQDWQEQKSPLAIGGVWVAAETTFEYGMMPLPVYKTPKSPSGGWSYGITQQSENRKEATEVIKWMTNADTVKGHAEAITMPPSRTSVFAQMDKFNSEPFKIVADQLKQSAQARPRTPVYPVLSKAFAEAYSAAAFGKDVKTALDEAVKKVDQQIAFLKK